jgi:hypothetical protein
VGLVWGGAGASGAAPGDVVHELPLIPAQVLTELSLVLLAQLLEHLASFNGLDQQKPFLLHMALGGGDALEAEVDVTGEPLVVGSEQLQVGRVERLLAPAGVCVFQLPYATADGHTGGVRVAHVPLPRPWWQRVRDRLTGPAASAPVMEMHAVPKAVVLELVAAHGARVVDVLEDQNAGGGHRSARYCVVRD